MPVVKTTASRKESLPEAGTQSFRMIPVNTDVIGKAFVFCSYFFLRQCLENAANAHIHFFDIKIDPNIVFKMKRKWKK